ncbi:MAG: glutathione S-transferase [Pseudomonadota bacterium]
MKLYTHPLSGHSHRVVNFVSLIGVDAEIVEVDLMAGAHKAPEFLQLNSFGQVPVLVDGNTVISDSNAILIYIAKKFGKTDWLPEDATGAANVQRWLSVAAGQIAFGPGAARLITLFGATSFDADTVITRAHGVLKVIDEELESRDFITGDTPTIADLALYSYIARAPEGNVDLGGYQSVRDWLNRIEALNGFVPFVKSPVGLEADRV